MHWTLSTLDVLVMTLVVLVVSLLLLRCMATSSSVSCLLLVGLRGVRHGSLPLDLIWNGRSGSSAVHSKLVGLEDTVFQRRYFVAWLSWKEQEFHEHRG